MDRIGEGRTAEVFDYGGGRVIKLYRNDTPPGLIEREFAAACFAKARGVSTPAALSITQDGGRTGIVFEKIAGLTVLRTILKNPLRAAGLMRKMACLHAAINALPYGDGEGRLCHGDFHTENVLVRGDDLFVIDWPNAHAGDPARDVCRSLMIIGNADPPEAARGAVRFFQLAVQHFLAAVYLRKYLSLTGMKLTVIKKWRLEVFSRRLEENPPPGEKARLLKAIEKLRRQKGGGVV